MPEIDKDLYQLLTLVLLGLGVLLLLAMLSSLGGIRKALKQQLERLESPAPSGAQSLDESREGDSADADLVGETREPLTGAEPAYSAASSESIGEEPDSAASLTPEPSTTMSGGYDLGESQSSGAGATSYPETSEPTPAPSEADGELASLASDAPAGAGGGVNDWQPDPERFGSQAQEPAASIDDPFGSGTLSSTPVDDEPAAATGGGAAQEPEDQPFERNGKWFFRRGDEFLRYDESTGQWVDADPSEAGTQASGPGAGWSAPEETGMPETGADSISDETATTEIESVGSEEVAAQPAAGGFWKCASCGAVNGSSATSCRMCFSQRP